MIKSLLKDCAETIDLLSWRVVDLVESNDKKFINTSDQQGKDIMYCYVYHDGFEELQELVCNGIAVMDGELCVLPTKYKDDYLTDDEALESTDWLSLSGGGMYLRYLPY